MQNAKRHPRGGHAPRDRPPHRSFPYLTRATTKFAGIGLLPWSAQEARMSHYFGERFW
ncbi:hypothetical protein K426_11700 [Sphingobium sp. TKS]|nr:hypothetical protein K426_11700 [Sphingobium sp. TKS]